MSSGVACSEAISYVIVAQLLVVMLSCPIPGAIAYTNAYFGSGADGIFLDNVGCRGTESTLLSCTNAGIGYHNCHHTDDAGVRCSGEMLSATTPILYLS